MKLLKGFIITLITGIIIAFCYKIFELKNVDVKDKLTICISFFSLFATFLGAYLGAKVSSDNARKMQKEQLEIQNLEKNIENNFVYLEEFSELIQNISSFNYMGIFTYFTLFYFKQYKRDFYKSLEDLRRQMIFYNNFMNTIERKDLYGTNVSSLVNKETKEYIEQVRKLTYFYVSIQKYILNLIRKNYTNIGENVVVNFQYYNDKECIFLLETSNTKEHIDIVNFDKRNYRMLFYYLKFLLKERKIKKIGKKLKYKNSSELIEYINNLYN
ncbi:hypothetical protein [Staphylococcus pasteuri]|uniref:hypothetical protein n=2 Tax=Staphylococcus pasteuri TaxID=45972 RepID=UPI0019037A51|nr:hypothetical protein [Staphylococcus pasteuri]QQN54859.1 hypothetical protein I6I26_04305 [Staphylococcus pasteuri]